MLIANPIYDTFFKYLLEDTHLAKILLSAIIEEDIISLELRPQELIIDIPEKYLSILRVDFKAVIRTPDGKNKKILIEMQKSRVLLDIMRFRKYLADNYGRGDEIFSQVGNKTEVLPITTIYFLNFKLRDVKFPVLKINRNYTNAVTKEITEVKDNFIEQLTHDCYAIQIPRLEINMQNKLEKLLSIFNQKYVTTKDQKILNLPAEWADDDLLNKFIEKLNKPLLSHEMIRKAEVEDEIEHIFETMDRNLLEARQSILEINQNLLEANQNLLETSQKLEEAEKQKQEAEKQKQEAENFITTLQQKQVSAVEKMLGAKILSEEQIADFLNLPLETVLNIKAKNL